MPTKIIFKLTLTTIFPNLVVYEKDIIRTWHSFFSGTKAPANATNFNIPENFHCSGSRVFREADCTTVLYELNRFRHYIPAPPVLY